MRKIKDKDKNDISEQTQYKFSIVSKNLFILFNKYIRTTNWENILNKELYQVFKNKKL